MSTSGAPSSQPASAALRRTWVVLVAACLSLSFGMILLSFRALSKERSYAALAAQIDRRIRTCPVPKEEIEDPPPPPGQRTVSFPNGVSLSLSTSLTDLATPNQRFVTLGDAVAHDHVTLINLWAPWCDPCLKEFPLLKSLLSGDPEVTFVPVLLSTELPEPKQYEAMMPPFDVFLSDYRGALRGELVAKKLYRDELPVTLLIGCQRKVRWVHFGALGEDDIRVLEEEMDALKAEVGTEKCAAPPPPEPRGPPRPAECGNGLCEQGEGQDNCCFDCCPGNDGHCDRGENPQSFDCKKEKQAAAKLNPPTGGGGKLKSKKYTGMGNSSGGVKQEEK